MSSAAQVTSRPAPRAPQEPILGLRSWGPEVAALQTQLRDLGFYQGPIDSSFGPITKRAVQALQRQAGLRADGAVGPDTRAALSRLAQRRQAAQPAQAPLPRWSVLDVLTPLRSTQSILGIPSTSPFALANPTATGVSPRTQTSAPQTAPADPTLEEGARGEPVRELQRLLSDAGYPVRADAIFGRDTKSAVHLFRLEYELPEGDSVDPATWRQLREAATEGRAGRVLRQGDQGVDIERAQALLVAAGLRLTVDGRFGPETRRQLLVFQRAHGLRETGSLTTSTWKALEATVPPTTATATATESSAPVLQLGSSGPEVEELQQLLREGGFRARRDGRFGPETKSALLRFQAVASLPTTGVADAQTLQALRAARTSVENPEWLQYRPGMRFPPGSPEMIALFEAAARRAGVPESWARSRALHELLSRESGGVVGIPNYTYRSRGDQATWPRIHTDLKAGRIRARSSATGLGQLLSRNARVYYPNGLDGIGVPLQEAIGMLLYIRQGYRTPERALAAYNSRHEGY